MSDFLYVVFPEVVSKLFNIDEYSMKEFSPHFNGLVVRSDTKNIPQYLRDDIRELVKPFIGDIKDCSVYPCHFKVQSEYSELFHEEDCEVYRLDIILDDYLGYNIEAQGPSTIFKGNAILFKVSNRYYSCFVDNEDSIVNVLSFFFFKDN